MPTESTTANFALRYPTAANNGTAFATGIADLATDVDKLIRLAPSSISSGATATNGQMLLVKGGTPLTVTMPTATTGALVGVSVPYASVSGTSPVTVAGGGATIYGPGIGISGLGSASIKLGSVGAFVMLQSDGTNWFVRAGAQDSGWITATIQSGWSSPGSSGGTALALRLVGDRVTYMGRVQNTSGSTSSTNVQFAQISVGSRPVDAITAAYIVNANNNGSVNLTFGGAGAFNVVQALANNGWFSLSGLTYLVI